MKKRVETPSSGLRTGLIFKAILAVPKISTIISLKKIISKLALVHLSMPHHL